jgi:CheY-like chemotaxis protein
MRTVFVIDDDRLMREVLSRHLEKSDYRVRVFQSPCHALPLIDPQYPDAIVSDVQMPGMTGLELARRVRERTPGTPVILITAAASPAVRDEASRVGVKELFEKPIKDVCRLVNALDRAIAGRAKEETSAVLDGLRLSFLTGLAHELRTPLTAMKLAIENLFAVHATDRPSTEGRLLAISQRNLDRIVSLVERQLDLLQVTLGDVSVARRLVSIRDVLEGIIAESPPSVRNRVRVAHRGRDEHPFCFTDPDRLRAVVRYLLEVAPFDENRSLTIEYGVMEGGDRVELRFDTWRVNVGGSDLGSSSSMDDAATVPGSRDAERVATSLEGDGFEQRAFRRIIASLDGEIRDNQSGDDAGVSVVFPVSPRFDPREDFDFPVGCLREAAMLSGRTISLIRCCMGHGTRTGSGISDEAREFFIKCRSALSEGDALVRGRPDGTYYLVLLGRPSKEIDHVLDFLRAPGPSGNGAEVDLETIIPAAPSTAPPSQTTEPLETAS